MLPIRIDFLRAKYQLEKQRRKPSLFFAYIFIVLFIFIATIGLVFSYQVASSQQTDDSLSHLSIFSTVRSLLLPHPAQIQGEKNDRINILLLGVGGSGHDGPELTDTIMLMSIKPSEKKVAFLSIPRDLTVPIPNYGWRKINNVNAFAEAKESKTGPQATSEILTSLFNLPIHYYLKIDFAGFAKIIDDLGGIDISIETSFIDTQYPTSDYLYQTISFQKGWEHMNGQRALTYTRSRHGNNGQGSDFARSQRQQQVLLAIKEKIMKASNLLHPLRINTILETLGDHITTNIDTWELIRLAKLVDIGQNISIIHKVLDISEGSPLYATSINGAYVILPKDDDWTPLQNIMATIFDEDTTTKLEEPQSNLVFSSIPSTNSPNVSTVPTSTALKNSVQIEIQNGTEINGLASKVAQILKGQGFDITTIGNAKKQTYTQTILYDFTEGTHEKEMNLLQEYLHADVQNTSSDWNYGPIETDEAPAPVDFLIILGSDNQNLLE
jgi:LCP family protein required for cell wall assembly